MSFDVNVLRQKPVIQAAANMQNDGGGGNLGYMAQGQGKKHEDEINIFMTKPEETDVFVSLNNIEISHDEKFDLVEWVKGIIAKIIMVFH